MAHFKAFLLALSLPALLLTGCASLPWKHTSAKPVLGNNADLVHMGDNISPQKTLELCLTTAADLQQQGHTREAMKLYEKARAMDPGAINYSARMAQLYAIDGRYAEAIGEYEQALAKSPSDVELLNDMAYAHQQQKDFARAEARLRQALSIAPLHTRAKTNLGIVLAEQSRYQESFDVFAAIVGPAAAHSNVGAIMARQGRTAEARQALSQAIAIDPACQVIVS